MKMKMGRRARPPHKIREEEKIHKHDLGNPEKKQTLLEKFRGRLSFPRLFHVRGDS